MSQGVPAERNEGGPETDQDPLLVGGETSVLARLRRSLPKFSFRNWRRPQHPSSDQEESRQRQDVESGPAISAEHLGTTLSAEPGPSRQAIGSSSDDSDMEEGLVPRSSSVLACSPDSPLARQGILGGLLRLGSAALPRSSNSLSPTCLICLEQLSPEDFESGDAIVLECQCRGDMAMRHRTCAEKWAHVKGNRVCDICKTVVKNLPDVPARAPDSATTTGGAPFEDGDPTRTNPQLFAPEQVPGGADVVFDCIRVTWVAMIICILFFDMNLANALWTGLIVGLAYTLFVRAMYRHQIAVMIREQQRSASETPVHQHVVHVV